MIKRIQANNKIFNSEPFQKDKYKFFLILQNLESETLELYSDEENYILCRGEKNYPTWIWTKDNFDISLLSEMEEAINLYRLNIDTRFTCKRELYNLLKQDNFKSLGDYYFEMGYLVCNSTIKPKLTDGKCELANENDKEILTKFMYDESREISDTKELTIKEAQVEVEKKLKDGNYRVIGGNAKIAGVYTLPVERGKAYAANLIYVLTNKVLNEGNHVSLYTDYKYIPSNKAYKNVGYIDDDVLINFSCTKK